MGNSKNVREFGMRDKIGYMFGDFGNDFTFILSSMFMLKFYTDVMGISPGVVGVLMMAARFIDAVTDVTMGQIVDRAKPTKDGKFKPWLKRMCGPVAIASFLIYQSGFANMSSGFKMVWMVIIVNAFNLCVMLLFKICNSLIFGMSKRNNIIRLLYIYFMGFNFLYLN